MEVGDEDATISRSSRGVGKAVHIKKEIESIAKRRSTKQME